MIFQHIIAVSHS